MQLSLRADGVYADLFLFMVILKLRNQSVSSGNCFVESYSLRGGGEF